MLLSISCNTTLNALTLAALQEVRLYTAACVIQILRLHAPDTPFTDAQLETIFSLFMSVFKELADPGAAHFQVCLGLLDTAAVIKCCLLMLDLDHANSLVSDLFSTLFDVVNAENKDAVEGPALQVLTVMLEESDDIPQPLLDGILGHLLPSARQESPVAHHMAQLLLRRAQPTLQPYVQKFLTRLLEGGRTDSELAGSCSDLILQVYQAAPQIMLPVIPHLQPGLQVESEERRLDSVDLICKLLTQPGGHSLVTDYPQLTDAVLSRLGDRSADVRMRVLSHARSLADCAADEEHRVKVADAVVLRLQDPEEKLRSAAAVELCGIAADHPHIMHTQQYQPLIQRLRDKRLPVRKEVAAQIVKLVKAWCMKLEDDSSTRGIRKEFVVNLVLGICGLTVTKDVELGAYILDDLFRAGIFPARLPAVSAARWWELVWQAGGKGGQSVLLKIIKGKCDVQRKVQEVLSLRERAKGEKGGAAKLNFGGEQEARGAEEPPAAQEGESAAEQMEGLLNNLASLLPSISKAEEGLQKLFAMKDNHIFRALGTLARFGTPYADAAQAAKDLQGRVGSRGPVADVVHSLSSRMMPNVIFPETLAALMDSMGESENGEHGHIHISDALPLH